MAYHTYFHRKYRIESQQFDNWLLLDRLIFFIITTHSHLVNKQMMKKRNNSTTSLKAQKGMLMSVQCVAKREGKLVTHKHCPIPKIPKKTITNKKDQTSQEQSSPSSRNAIHELINNMVNSSDRVAALVKEDDRSCAYELYLQDRNKVVQFLDSFIENGKQNTIQHEQQKNTKGTFREDYLNKQLEAIRTSIDKAVHRKKRSKSSYPLLAFPQYESAEKGDRLSTIRFLLAQQSAKNNALKLQKADLVKQIQRLQSNFVYTELLTFKSQQMFIENLIQSNQSVQFSLIEKEKAASVLNSLRQTILHIRSQSDVSTLTITNRLKQQAQSLLLYISEMKRKALAILKEKERSLARLQQEQQNFQRLKEKASRLNDEMAELVEEVDRKDELIEYVKLQNNNLKEDLNNMEQMVRITKQQYQSFVDEHYLLSQRVKILQSLLQSKDDHIGELLNEIENKNKDLIVKLQQIQAKDEDMLALKQEQVLLEQSNAKVISTLNEEKKLIALQKQRKQNELRETQSKVKFLQEQGSILQKKIQTVFNQEQQYKIRITTLQEKIQALERQNQQLYNEIRSMQKQQMENLIQNNKKLQRECQSLRQEVLENSKRIKFYQEQMVQLAKMTDTSYFEKALQDHRKIITQLQFKLSKYQHPLISPILQENSDEIEHQNSPIQSIDGLLSVKNKSEEHAQSKGEELLQDLIDCIPSFEQKEKVLSEHSHKLPNQLNVSREEHSCVSGLSFYEIHITNQNLDRIQSQQALSPKKAYALQAHLFLAIKAPSNYADCQPSQFQQVIQQTSKKQNEKPHQASDSQVFQSEEMLSSISRNVNVDDDNENDHEIQDEIQTKTPMKTQKIQDLLMTDAQSRLKGHSPIKYVDEHQNIKAQLRFQGEIQRQVKVRTNDQKDDKLRRNVMLNNNVGKMARARSCMGKDD